MSAALIVPLLLLAPTLAVADFLILDNRLYLPLAGIALGVMAVAEQTLVVMADSKRMLYAGWAITIVALGMVSVHHAGAFESPRAFCEAAVAGSPHLALAQVNLGSTEFHDGHFEAAEEHYRRAIAIDSRWPVAHNDLGLLYLNRGQLAQAESEFLTELSNNPDYPKAHFNLGLVLRARVVKNKRANTSSEWFKWCRMTRRLGANCSSIGGRVTPRAPAISWPNAAIGRAISFNERIVNLSLLHGTVPLRQE